MANDSNLEAELEDIINEVQSDNNGYLTPKLLAFYLRKAWIEGRIHEEDFGHS